jgi:hypothetical protein
MLYQDVLATVAMEVKNSDTTMEEGEGDYSHVFSLLTGQLLTRAVAFYSWRIFAKA